MSQDTAIEIAGLKKCYRIGRKVNPTSMRNRLARLPRQVKEGFHQVFARREPADLSLAATDDNRVIWALKGIDLTIGRGEVVGIVGPNGSGKSTLLKILSRVTTPTEGQVAIYGRVGALLEVGTGFHPELTGRENIFLNGAILGMKRREISGKFQAIVDFSGVGQFLDTPVKRYSSGMKVRLGFAVAAHLSLDILLIDEVLSVGDMEFRDKCLGRMDEIAHTGRTIVFVSHNMAQVQQLCQRCIMLDKGVMVKAGTPAEVIKYYTGLKRHSIGAGMAEMAGREEADRADLAVTSVAARNDRGEVCGQFDTGARLVVEIVLGNRAHRSFILRVFIHNARGVKVYHLRSRAIPAELIQQQNQMRVQVEIPRLALVDGSYSLTVTLSDGMDTLLEDHADILQFQVIDRTGVCTNWPAIVHENGVWHYQAE